MALPDRVDCDALLKRAIQSAKKATSLDHSGEYNEALAFYDSTVKDLSCYVENEVCQSMVDCVMSKLALYSNRARLLRATVKGFDDGDYVNDISNDDSFFASSSEQRGYGTSTSSDSGMYEMSPDGSSHNTSHEENSVEAITSRTSRDEMADLERSSRLSDCCYYNCCEFGDAESVVGDDIVHAKGNVEDEQVAEKRRFFQSCDRLVNNLLELIQDGNLSEAEIARTQEKLDRILLLSQKYQQHYASADAEGICQRLSRTSSIVSLPHPTVATELLQTAVSPAGESRDPAVISCSRLRGDHRQLVRADVLHSAHEPLGRDLMLSEAKARVENGGMYGGVAEAAAAVRVGGKEGHDDGDDDDDDFPELPVDGSDEFSALQGSLTSLPMADGARSLLRRPRQLRTTTSASADQLDVIESATLVAPPTSDVIDRRPKYVTQAMRRHHSVDSLTEVRGSPGFFWSLLNCLCG